MTMDDRSIPSDMFPTREELFGSWALYVDMDPVDLGRCLLVRSYDLPAPVIRTESE